VGKGELPPFLDEFRANKEVPVVEEEITFPSAAGPVRANWGRPGNKDPLPALLLVYDDEAWTAWMKTNVRNLAGIGYEVVALNVAKQRQSAVKAGAGPFTDQAALAVMSGAVRWLRGRPTVAPGRMGVIGWNWSGGQALALASAMSLQACVVCEAPLPTEAGIILGLRGKSVLGVYAARDKGSQKELPAFRKLLADQQVPGKFHVASTDRGFMGPPGNRPCANQVAEDTWVEIYNFLEKHVEDAVAGHEVSGKGPATIADIMRAVNEPSGLRGAISKALEKEPAGERQWQSVRANAALIAEAGVWLQQQSPAKGQVGHWKEQSRAYTAAAEEVVHAADRRDYAGARQGLVRLAGQCASCHLEHR
jgi:dienelactone hydrolase/cytochrome c556